MLTPISNEDALSQEASDQGNAPYIVAALSTKFSLHAVLPVEMRRPCVLVHFEASPACILLVCWIAACVQLPKYHSAHNSTLSLLCRCSMAD